LGTPIVGDFELISFLGAVVVGFSLPYTTLKKGHVAVDFFLEMISKSASSKMQIATRVVSTALFAWIGWNFIVMSMDLIKSGEVTPLFRLPFYPISFGLAFTCLIQCIVLILQAKELAGGKNE
jgi:TRAP-type C4-dicarboxylate transport system permease small subunit